MTSDRHFLAAAALALLANSAHAGRPLVSEDAGVLGKGECEWESFLASARVSGAPTANGWNTQLGCGVLASSQVALSVGQVKGGGITGHQVASISGKTGLYKNDGGDLAVALAWGVLGTRYTGGSFGTDNIFLNGVLTKQLSERVTINVNLGWTEARRVSPKHGASNANLALEYTLGNGLEVMGEVMSVDGESGFGMGLRYAASKAWSLNLGYLVQNPSPQYRQWSLGAKFTF